MAQLHNSDPQRERARHRQNCSSTIFHQTKDNTHGSSPSVNLQPNEQFTNIASFEIMDTRQECVALGYRKLKMTRRNSEVITDFSYATSTIVERHHACNEASKRVIPKGGGSLPQQERLHRTIFMALVRTRTKRSSLVSDTCHRFPIAHKDFDWETKRQSVQEFGHIYFSSGKGRVEKEQQFGGHAMALIGYNDVTRQFKVVNSWGKQWGDNGCCYVPYEFLLNERYCDDFWTIGDLPYYYFFGTLPNSKSRSDWDLPRARSAQWPVFGVCHIECCLSMMSTFLLIMPVRNSEGGYNCYPLSSDESKKWRTQCRHGSIPLDVGAEVTIAFSEATTVDERGPIIVLEEVGRRVRMTGGMEGLSLSDMEEQAFTTSTSEDDNDVVVIKDDNDYDESSEQELPDTVLSEKEPLDTSFNPILNDDQHIDVVIPVPKYIPHTKKATSSSSSQKSDKKVSISLPPHASHSSPSKQPKHKKRSVSAAVASSVSHPVTTLDDNFMDFGLFGLDININESSGTTESVSDRIRNAVAKKRAKSAPDRVEVSISDDFDVDGDTLLLDGTASTENADKIDENVKRNVEDAMRDVAMEQGVDLDGDMNVPGHGKFGESPFGVLDLAKVIQVALRKSQQQSSIDETTASDATTLQHIITTLSHRLSHLSRTLTKSTVRIESLEKRETQLGVEVEVLKRRAEDAERDVKLWVDKFRKLEMVTLLAGSLGRGREDEPRSSDTGNGPAIPKDKSDDKEQEEKQEEEQDEDEEEWDVADAVHPSDPSSITRETLLTTASLVAGKKPFTPHPPNPTMPLSQKRIPHTARHLYSLLRVHTQRLLECASMEEYVSQLQTQHTELVHGLLECVDALAEERRWVGVWRGRCGRLAKEASKKKRPKTLQSANKVHLESENAADEVPGTNAFTIGKSSKYSHRKIRHSPFGTGLVNLTPALDEHGYGFPFLPAKIKTTTTTTTTATTTTTTRTTQPQPAPVVVAADGTPTHAFPSHPLRKPLHIQRPRYMQVNEELERKEWEEEKARVKANASASGMHQTGGNAKEGERVVVVVPTVHSHLSTPGTGNVAGEFEKGGVLQDDRERSQKEGGHHFHGHTATHHHVHRDLPSRQGVTKKRVMTPATSTPTPFPPIHT
ncbi:hypothetical protein BC832DRAFT_612221 [Gaertneriomyces semiglobifer]|nr:hypothetical protein BC832DRAFT_612221 [Gaertneriomyces semiglobifer]